MVPCDWCTFGCWWLQPPLSALLPALDWSFISCIGLPMLLTTSGGIRWESYEYNKTSICLTTDITFSPTLLIRQWKRSEMRFFKWWKASAVRQFFHHFPFTFLDGPILAKVSAAGEVLHILLIVDCTIDSKWTIISLLFAGYGLSYHLATALVVWVGSDFYEFAYHRLGHVSFPFWKQHKHHHVFFNPSPFAVIADEWIDQVRLIWNVSKRLRPEHACNRRTLLLKNSKPFGHLGLRPE